MCPELIDTLWNVNEVDDGYMANLKQELIDKLWNVNIPGVLPYEYAAPRFNRYIVECKFCISSDASS